MDIDEERDKNVPQPGVTPAEPETPEEAAETVSDDDDDDEDAGSDEDQD